MKSVLWTVACMLLLGGCGSSPAPRSQIVSRAEMAGIVRPAGEIPTGKAKITVTGSDGVAITVEIDREAFWRETGITLPVEQAH